MRWSASCPNREERPELGMRTLPCITVRVLFGQRPGAGIAPRGCLLGDHGGMDVLSSRVLLQPTDPERSRVFYRDTLGLAIYREFGSGPERGTVFFLGGGFLELSGRGAAPRPRAWRCGCRCASWPGCGGSWVSVACRSCGSPSGSRGAAGDVDRRPGRGADLHRGGAGGASATPPRLKRHLHLLYALPQWRALSGAVLSGLPGTMTGWPRFQNRSLVREMWFGLIPAVRHARSCRHDLAVLEVCAGARRRS